MPDYEVLTEYEAYAGELGEGETAMSVVALTLFSRQAELQEDVVRTYIVAGEDAVKVAVGLLSAAEDLAGTVTDETQESEEDA